MADALQGKYAVTSRMYGALPTWLGPLDAERLASYAVYEDLYWNEPNTHKLVFRGSEDDPIYVPSAKVIIEACNRYLMVGFNYAMFGADADDASLAMDTLFRREAFWSKFISVKRFGLVRGDAVWHLTGDPEKPAGRRLSVHEVDPGALFPIYDDNDRLTGYHLVDQYPDPKDPSKVYIRRQTYRKEDTGRISSELTLWEQGKWDDRPEAAVGSRPPELTKVGTLTPKFELPPQITALPVYHIKNQSAGVDPFGSSEVRGLERIITGLTQAVSDMELAIALEGLGQYWTNSGPPLNADGTPGEWALGPGSMIELKGENVQMGRVQGITNADPYVAFVNMLRGFMQESSGTPDIAVGSIDVTTAESGIALFLKMSPLLAKNQEKEQEQLDTYDHMFFDLLNGWMPAYEALSFDANCIPTVKDPMPVNRAAVIQEVLSLMSTSPPLVSAEQGRQMLRDRLGMEFPTEAAEQVLDEQAAFAAAQDTFAARLRSERGEGGETA